MKRQTKNVFIENAKLIHDDKYDYSLVDYVNSLTKVKIICKTHGIFEQRPNGHISQKQGCPKCVGKNKTTSEFIYECGLVHGDKYDYSLVKYVNNKQKINIICKTHGVFEQEANAHLMGRGCRKCTHNHTTNENFIEKAKLIHGDKYDYSLVNYVNNKQKINIICKTHGVFEQECSSHMNGSGCPKCVGKNKTTSEFIEKAKLIHGDKYDYSLTNYIGVFKKVKIICKTHGVFEQKPQHHLRDSGCPICKESKGEKQIRRFLIKNGVKFFHQYKFSDCKDIKQLPFDFYLPEHNTCIEYDGRQHFEAIDRWGGVNGLIDQQRKDNIKNIFCENNKIKLLRISHKESIYNKLKQL